MRATGVSLGLVGGMIIIVGLLFAFWAHQSIGQAEYIAGRFEGYSARSPENFDYRPALQAAVEPVVKDWKTQRSTWLFVTAGGAGILLLGYGLVRIGDRNRLEHRPMDNVPGYS